MSKYEKFFILGAILTGAGIGLLGGPVGMVIGAILGGIVGDEIRKR